MFSTKVKSLFGISKRLSTQTAHNDDEHPIQPSLVSAHVDHTNEPNNPAAIHLNAPGTFSTFSIPFTTLHPASHSAVSISVNDDHTPHSKPKPVQPRPAHARHGSHASYLSLPLKPLSLLSKGLKRLSFRSKGDDNLHASAGDDQILEDVFGPILVASASPHPLRRRSATTDGILCSQEGEEEERKATYRLASPRIRPLEEGMRAFLAATDGRSPLAGCHKRSRSQPIPADMRASIHPTCPTPTKAHTSTRSLPRLESRPTHTAPAQADALRHPLTGLYNRAGWDAAGSRLAMLGADPAMMAWFADMAEQLEAEKAAALAVSPQLT